MSEPSIASILKMHDMLEKCQFKSFWTGYLEWQELVSAWGTEPLDRVVLL